MRSQSARRALVALGIGVVALGAVASHAGVVAVGTAELQSLMEREGDRVFLLDVRTPGEYRQGHVAGSVLIPMREVPDRLKEIPEDRRIVVVCASGARSGAVARYLDEHGFPWVANYTGGVFDWARHGLPLER